MPKIKKEKKKGSGIMSRVMAYYFKLYPGLTTATLVLLLISAGANIVGTIFMGRIIDDHIVPMINAGSTDYSGLLVTLMIMLGAYTLGVIATFFYTRFSVTIGQGIIKHIRDELFEHMQKLPISYFDSHKHGDIMSVYSNDVETLRGLLAESIPSVISSLVSMTTVFITMWVLNYMLAIFVLIILCIMLMLMKLVGGKSGKYFMKQQVSIGAANAYIEEMVNGQKVIKVFCHEGDVSNRFKEINEELCENATKANSAANVLMPIIFNLGNLQYGFIAVVGGLLSFYGIIAVSLGTIGSFLQLSKAFTGPIGQVAQQITNVATSSAGAKRLFDLMHAEVETDQGYVTLVNAEYKDGVLGEAENRTGLFAWKHPHRDGTLTYAELKGEVRFYDVDFAYVEGKNVLENVTLYAEPGQKIAFVGATGAGKTTITNLINRFYDIADGKIRYDDININKIRKSDLRRSLGVVLQDVHLFSGTVRENIRYGKLDATDEEVYAAARLVNADTFISMLPDGYDTVISGDGADISQGQKQLISIARAAVADPPVMILDEATSSIDTRTEAIVQAGMDSLMKGRTVFVIAHRLSTIQNSDVIMVLDKGRIIERGSHEKLLEEKGTYYRLYTGNALTES